MYPFARLALEVMLNRKAAPLPLDGVHVSRHRCWPWDLDLWAELNNGRTLTLYDLGRLPFASRVGLLAALKRRGWGLTMAGASVRYRRRVRMLDRVEMHSSCVGRDARFLYLTQSMWCDGEATSSILYRCAVTGKSGIVPTDDVARELGHPDWRPTLPDWVQHWIEAEADRPWPPRQDQ